MRYILMIKRDSSPRKGLSLKTLIFIVVIAFATPASTAFAKTTILLGQDYFQATHQAIQEAEESIYVAMYLINVQPQPTPTNPASILLESLIAAHNRGVSVKVILDDTKFSINYHAYKRLHQAGVDVSLDNPQTVLHGKAIVIDSKICILGSHNWSRASLKDNYEFSTYTEDPQLSQTLLDYLNRIELKPNQIPILPQQYPGLKLPLSLLTGQPKSKLSQLLTSQSQKAFDLYLYLYKISQAQNTDTININYRELGQALGYTKNYYFNVYQPLNKLKKRYRLIQHRPWSKTLTLTKETGPEITIPDAYWDYGLNAKLSFPAKYMFLVSLAEAEKSQRNPYWFRSNADLSEIYYISPRSITKGITQLEAENILEVYRHKPEEPGDFENRPANNYRLNPLQSDQDFEQALQALARKHGADTTQKARELSAKLNEPKDLQKIETYIDLIKEYGHARVAAANSEVSTRRRETGFHDISQVILLLKQED